MNAIPEVTAAGPANLQLTISVDCSSQPHADSNGLIFAANLVTADFTWDRLDLWPSGVLRRNDTGVDYVSLWVEGTPAIGEEAAEFLGRDGNYYMPNRRSPPSSMT